MKHILMITLSAALLFVCTGEFRGVSLEAQEQSDYIKQLEQAYADEDYWKLQEQMDALQQSEAEREESERQQRTWMLWSSILVALIPSFVIIRKLIKGQLRYSGPWAVVRAAAVLLLGGLLLGGVNYALLWLRQSDYRVLFVYFVFLALVVGLIVLYTKKGPSDQQEA